MLGGGTLKGGGAKNTDGGHRKRRFGDRSVQNQFHQPGQEYPFGFKNSSCSVLELHDNELQAPEHSYVNRDKLNKKGPV